MSAKVSAVGNERLAEKKDGMLLLIVLKIENGINKLKIVCLRFLRCVFDAINMSTDDDYSAYDGYMNSNNSNKALDFKTTDTAFNFKLNLFQLALKPWHFFGKGAKISAKKKCANKSTH